MGKSRESLQRNTDGRWYTVVDYSVKGKYPRVYLKTKNKAQARRRLAALDGIEETTEARRRVDALATCETEEEERGLVATMLETPKFVPDRDKVKRVLERTFKRYEIETPVTDQMVSQWLGCERSKDYIDLLTEWGVPPVHIGTSGTVIMRVYQQINFSLNPRWVKKHPDQKHEALSELHGIPIQEFNVPAGAPSKERLSDCLATWRSFKKDKRPQHVKQYATIFERFISLVGDQPVNKLTKSYFVTYEKHVNESQGKRSNKWHQDQLVPVRAVLLLARRKMDCEFPDGLRDWIDFDKKPHVVATSNKQPMPLEIYQALLSKAEEWVALDVDEYVKNTPTAKGLNAELSKAGRKKQAQTLKRAGVIWAPVLKLCCQCGLDPIDISRMEWDKHLKHLNDKFPYLDFPRGKMEGRTGAAIERLIPLLSSTVASLQRLREMRKSELKIHRHLVCANDAKRPFTSSHLARGFKRLRDSIENGDGWSLKHLRNVGPTLGKRHKRPTDERDAFLGHAVGGKGTSRWYEGDVDERYLKELVNLIGREYFNGETIGKPALRLVGQKGA